MNRVTKPDDLEKAIDDCDVVLFTGGADVSPHLYCEPRGARTNCQVERDRFEVWVANMAIKKEKKMLGICRGAQLMCVMAGGKLIQDVDGHLRSHGIEDVFGNVMLMPSTHHQMMRPDTADDSVCVAWAKYPLSKNYTDGSGAELYQPFAHIEPEIAYFPKIRALAIQGHPEMSSDVHLHKYCSDLVEFYLFGEQEMKQPHYPIPNPAV